MQNFAEKYAAFVGFLYSDLDESEDYPNQRPRLAYYTSLISLEKILVSQEIWLSNPLFMNDLEELRFGVEFSYSMLRESAPLREAFNTAELYDEFMLWVEEEYMSFQRSGALDVYVSCFSLHDPIETDGRLTMWRGYGDNGNGAAIIFDTASIPEGIQIDSLILGKVHYASTAQRKDWVRAKLSALAITLKSLDFEFDDLEIVARVMFERLVVFSLFSKHSGFSEENEWRLVYLKSRDREQTIASMISYFNGPRGIEPKLKLNFSSLLSDDKSGLTFEDLIHSIILGPTSSSPLSVQSTKRMLSLLGYQKLARTLHASSIPYRG